MNIVVMNERMNYLFQIQRQSNNYKNIQNFAKMIVKNQFTSSKESCPDHEHQGQKLNENDRLLHDRELYEEDENSDDELFQTPETRNTNRNLSKERFSP